MTHYVGVEDRHFLRVAEAGRRLLRIAALKKGLSRSHKETAAHASLRYRQELKPLKIAAGHTVPENFLDPFQGCEDVRDPAQSF